MKDIAHSNSLPDLAARITVEHEACAAAMKTTLVHAIAAGTLLLEAKQQIPHGEWLPWLRDNCPFSERLAQSYCRLARNAEMLKSADSADLTVDAALNLLARPTVTEAIADPEPGPAGALDRSPWLELCVRCQLELAKIDPRIRLTSTGLALPDGLPYEKWLLVGKLLHAYFAPLIAAAAPEQSRRGG